MSKIRILAVLHTLDYGGAPKFALDVLEEMGQDVSVLVLALKGGPLAERCRALGRLHVIETLVDEYSRLKRALSPPFRWALGTWIAKWHPDVIYVNSVASIPVMKFIRLPDAPVILHVHELDSIFSRYAEQQPHDLCARPDRYIAVSQAVSDMLTGRYGVDDTKVRLAYPFVDSSTPVAVPSTDRTRSQLVVGGAGLLGWRKGPELWLLMALELRRLLGRDNVRFVWLGIRDDEASWQFRDMATKLRLEADITMLPVTSNPLRVFAEFDIFAMTSWEDPCPRVVMENMMLGKPVVCFAGGGGAAEIVGEAGVVVPEFSPNLLADAIYRLSRDRRRLASLGAAARARIESSFTEVSQMPRIRGVFDELAGRKHHNHRQQVCVKN